MVSETLSQYLDNIRGEVLILVLVEDGLGEYMDWGYNDELETVLILVLVEDGLGEFL